MAIQQGDRQARSFSAASSTTAPTIAPEDFRAIDVETRSTYRLLLMRGLDAADAANLTAYLCGIDVRGTHWTLAEINRLLFLRRLARSRRWGAAEDAASTEDRPAKAA
jgi:hypothetical protein